MGAAALAGRPGIESVTKGFRCLEEVDRVTYDPGEVSVPEMEAWLKQAGTYVRTLASGGEAHQRDTSALKWKQAEKEVR